MIDQRAQPDEKTTEEIIDYWKDASSMSDWAGYEKSDVDALSALRNFLLNAGSSDNDGGINRQPLVRETDRYIHEYEKVVVKRMTMRNGLKALIERWEDKW